MGVGKGLRSSPGWGTAGRRHGGGGSRVWGLMPERGGLNWDLDNALRLFSEFLSAI